MREKVTRTLARACEKARHRTGRVLRASAITLLALIASGAMPAAITCFDELRGCDGACARCWCKRRPAGAAFRLRCACCQPQAGADPMSVMRPAILPVIAAAAQPSHVEALTSTGTSIRLFVPSIPHPPPRTTTHV